MYFMFSISYTFKKSGTSADTVLGEFESAKLPPSGNHISLEVVVTLTRQLCRSPHALVRVPEEHASSSARLFFSRLRSCVKLMMGSRSRKS